MTRVDLPFLEIGTRLRQMAEEPHQRPRTCQQRAGREAAVLVKFDDVIRASMSFEA
jgi:hypothetical protein